MKYDFLQVGTIDTKLDCSSTDGLIYSSRS